MCDMPLDVMRIHAPGSYLGVVCDFVGGVLNKVPLTSCFVILAGASVQADGILMKISHQFIRLRHSLLCSEAGTALARPTHLLRAP